ncbi:hypothetical protein Mco01_55370 [Microbispora corallina]|uniref:Uncharacterized protein n=1 Tax=Microbispora corallina TaxID=83302 RepID=A0ABQ4G638_9ACTN|nr:hypothetical protein Mco01_55370 [Microbispora corallina]
MAADENRIVWLIAQVPLFSGGQPVILKSVANVPVESLLGSPCLHLADDIGEDFVMCPRDVGGQLP